MAAAPVFSCFWEASVMCPRVKTIFYILLALIAGALLCAILPGWLVVCIIGLCALAAAVLLIIRRI